MRDWTGPLGMLFYTLELSTAGLHIALCEASDANYFVLSDLGLDQSLIFPLWLFLPTECFLSQKSMPTCPVNHKIKK